MLSGKTTKVITAVLLAAVFSLCAISAAFAAGDETGATVKVYVPVEAPTAGGNYIIATDLAGANGTDGGGVYTHVIYDERLSLSDAGEDYSHNLLFVLDKTYLASGSDYGIDAQYVIAPSEADKYNVFTFSQGAKNGSFLIEHEDRVPYFGPMNDETPDETALPSGGSSNAYYGVGANAKKNRTYKTKIFFFWGTDIDETTTGKKPVAANHSSKGITFRYYKRNSINFCLWLNCRSGSGGELEIRGNTCSDSFYTSAEATRGYDFTLYEEREVAVGEETTEHIHAWDEGAVTTPATCEGEGVKTFTCACGETKTESIPANGHSFVSTVISPTCTEDGYTLWECENCDASYTSDTVAASGHTWDEGAVTTPATCESEGVKTFTCACGETKTESIPANGHSFVSTVISPTCTEDGYTLWECENCNSFYTSDPVAASGHTWDEGAVTTPATCEGEGVKTFTCECGETKTETIPSNGHSYVPTVIAPTCTEDGYTLWECENCDTSFTSDPVAASGHTWDEGAVTTPATCEGEGVKTFTCECGETKTETIPANGHSFVSTVISPTCTEDGYTLWECENCDSFYTSDPVAASGHTWGEGAVTTPATCEGEGVKTFTCECGETKTETIPANGHSYVPTVIAPTCTVDGYTLWECENCDASYTSDPVAASGHTWDEGAVTTPATCEGEGVKTFTCACGETKTETIPANGHSYVPTVIAPTCTEDGYTLWECENCDSFYTSDEVAASGHKWDNGTLTTPPAVGREGVKTFRCAACGEEMTGPVPALEDEEPASETQPAGEDQNPSDNASGEGVCAFCGEVHDRSFSGRFITFFHAIFAFFKRLFGA